ncbi:MAG: DUF885 domain-containing protein [Bacteroidia bacterium]|nr:DUF885 domain-containing protein [Bacteroidia bacterium]
MRNFLLIVTAIISLIACNSNKPSTMENSNAAFDSLLHEYYEDRLKLYPLEATAIADERYNDQLPVDISDSYREKLKTFYSSYAEKFKTIDRAALSGQSVLSFDIMQYEMKMQLEGLTFHDNLMPINQFWSMHISFPLLGSGSGNQPFKTVKNYDDFLGRIHGFTSYVDTMISNMKRGMAMGIVPPKSLMEKVLPQLTGIIVKDPMQSVFAGPIKKFPESFSAEDKKRLTDLYTAAIKNEIVPSYDKLHSFVKNEYLPKCRATSGISEVPGGKEVYAYLAKFWTTTNLTPDEIYAIGEKEVARIRGEMERIKTETGFKGTLKEFFHFIHTDNQFMPFKQDSDVINAYRAIETKMQPQLKKLFNLVPKAKFEVRQTEAFREVSASAEYNQAAPDGSRPGIFYVPVLDPTKFNNVSMEDLFLHEAIPGHHYQTSIQQENKELPDFRRFGWYGAYGEGWALYTESLGKELGLYTDPYQYFGALSEEMHRALRLVLDVGIHLKGMTREQAIAYSLDNETESEADITAEVERYMAIPGQALAYKIGQMKILELRARAEKELGSKFNIQAFHDEVLINGCLPLEIFEKEVDRWIKAGGK